MQRIPFCAVVRAVAHRCRRSPEQRFCDENQPTALLQFPAQCIVQPPFCQYPPLRRLPFCSNRYTSKSTEKPLRKSWKIFMMCLHTANGTLRCSEVECPAGGGTQSGSADSTVHDQRNFLWVRDTNGQRVSVSSRIPLTRREHFDDCDNAMSAAPFF